MVRMAGYIIVSIAGGMLILMDVLINENPLALSLYEFYKPIARTSVNVPAGVGIICDERHCCTGNRFEIQTMPENHYQSGNYKAYY